jgi:hypothetical protein
MNFFFFSKINLKNYLKNYLKKKKNKSANEEIVEALQYLNTIPMQRKLGEDLYSLYYVPDGVV